MSWQENLQPDELPPEWMWTVDSELKEWFEELDRAREEKYGKADDRETTPMMGNELAKGRR